RIDFPARSAHAPLRFVERTTKEEVMKKVLSGIALLASLCLVGSIARAQDVANGKKVYKAKCASCHGPDGKGETAAGKATKARDLCSADVKKEADAAWTDIILKGKNKMPAYDKKITDAEVKDVIAYMRSLCK
ncbi:MAG TPA: cytochrome c, partial [Candidatus Sulfotelmatobacter sp.]|nr:cytochrome c [Candidatus Sulfotelmatobacter sp.]